MRLLSFTIDAHQYGVSADAVAEIVRAVAVTPLPGAPALVEGIVDVRGAIVPVFDLRRSFSRASRAIAISDHLIIVRTPARVAALHVDQVLDLVDVDDSALTAPSRQVNGAPQIAGVATLPDGLVLIHDADTFLSGAESASLDRALDSYAGLVPSTT